MTFGFMVHLSLKIISLAAPDLSSKVIATKMAPRGAIVKYIYRLCLQKHFNILMMPFLCFVGIQLKLLAFGINVFNYCTFIVSRATHFVCCIFYNI